MQIKAQGGMVELTDDALVIHRKKGDRVLPLDTIASVEYVAARSWIATGYIRPLLFGDTTRTTSATLDPNQVVPFTTSAEERDQVVAFAQALLARVEAASPKRVHPQVADFASNPSALRAAVAQGAREEKRAAAEAAKDQVRAEEEAAKEERRAFQQAEAAEKQTAALSAKEAKQEAARVAQREADAEKERVRHEKSLAKEQAKEEETQRRIARYAEIRAKEAAAEAELIAKNPDLERDIQRALDNAVRYAASGEIGGERAAIESALNIAKGRGGKKWLELTQRKVNGLNGQGKILIGARRLGSIEPQASLFGSLLGSAEDGIEVYSDRVAQGSSCRAIDAHTRATVHLDGTKQTVVSRSYGRTYERVEDGRTAEFLVSGSGWGFRIKLHPDRVDQPRQLAAQINIAAEKAAALVPGTSSVPVPLTAKPVPSSGDLPSSIEQLEKLHTLHQSGAIDDEEFKALKRALMSAVR